MRAFLPAAGPAQADYEELRAAVLGGAPLDLAASARFERGGLEALISAPLAPPAHFLVELVGAVRPAWAPYADPRVDALAEGYSFIVAATDVANLAGPTRIFAKEA